MSNDNEQDEFTNEAFNHTINYLRVSLHMPDRRHGRMLEQLRSKALDGSELSRQLADARKALDSSTEATNIACRRVHQLDSAVIELSEREKIKSNMFEQLRRQLTDTQKANNILIQKLKDAHSQIEAQTQVLAKDVMERAIRSDDFSLTFTVIVEKKA